MRKSLQESAHIPFLRERWGRGREPALAAGASATRGGVFRGSDRLSGRRRRSHHDSGSPPCSFAPRGAAGLGVPSSSAQTKAEWLQSAGNRWKEGGRRGGGAHRGRCPPPPPAGWRWSRPCPSWKPPGLRKTELKPGAGRERRLLRIRVRPQQHLPPGPPPPPGLLREGPGDFQKLPSCSWRREDTGGSGRKLGPGRAGRRSGSSRTPTLAHEPELVPEHGLV